MIRVRLFSRIFLGKTILQQYIDYRQLFGFRTLSQSTSALLVDHRSGGRSGRNRSNRCYPLGRWFWVSTNLSGSVSVSFLRVRLSAASDDHFVNLPDLVSEAQGALLLCHFCSSPTSSFGRLIRLAPLDLPAASEALAIRGNAT